MKKTYEKPDFCVNAGLAEGIYLSSGSAVDTGSNGCDSIYMQGVFHPANPNGITYMDKFGCQTCPSGNHNGCKLANGAAPKDKGKNKPNWERKGHTPNEICKK